MFAVLDTSDDKEEDSEEKKDGDNVSKDTKKRKKASDGEGQRLIERFRKELKKLEEGDYGEEEEKDEKAIDKAIEALPGVFKILDDQLEGKDYILGDKFNLADINVGSVVLISDFAQYDFSSYKNVAQWISRLNERPSFEQIPFPMKK